MFGLFKETMTSKKAGYKIAYNAGQCLGALKEAVDTFLSSYPQYQSKRSSIIDEVYLLLVTGGLIAIRILSDNKQTTATKNEVISFYRILHDYNPHLPILNEAHLQTINEKFEKYIVRFNRGMAFREDSPTLLHEALLDVANQSMEYITGEVRYSAIENLEDWDVLQTRPDPNELELFVKGVLGQFVNLYLDQFDNVKFVA